MSVRRTTDPAKFAVVVALFGSVGALACWMRARRTAKADPMMALRSE